MLKSKLFDRCRAGLLAEQKTVMERQALRSPFRQGIAHTTWQGDVYHLHESRAVGHRSYYYMSLRQSGASRSRCLVTQKQMLRSELAAVALLLGSMVLASTNRSLNYRWRLMPWWMHSSWRALCRASLVYGERFAHSLLINVTETKTEEDIANLVALMQSVVKWRQRNVDWRSEPPAASVLKRPVSKTISFTGRVEGPSAPRGCWPARSV